jgi:hypothetical protein
MEEAHDMASESGGGEVEAIFVPDLKKINAAGKHLLALINDILDLSKIEAGKMDLYLETFGVAEMIRDVSATIQPLVDKNSNRLEIEIAPGVGPMRADLTKVRQALFNLLSNASKFTRSGLIDPQPKTPRPKRRRIPVPLLLLRRLHANRLTPVVTTTAKKRNRAKDAKTAKQNKFCSSLRP